MSSCLHVERSAEASCPVSSPPAGHAARPRLRTATTWLVGVALSLGLCATAPTWAQTPDPGGMALVTAMDEAYRDLERADENNTAAVEKAADAYARLLKAYPGHPLVMVYAGASTAMRAYTTLAPWKKMRYVEDGLAQIDKAVALLGPGYDLMLPNGMPVALETRFTAAKAQLDLPSFFNRRTRGKRLLDEVLASPQFPTAPLILRGEAWLSAGNLAAEEKRPADARRWFERIVEAKAPQAAKAQARLKEIAP